MPHTATVVAYDFRLGAILPFHNVRALESVGLRALKFAFDTRSPGGMRSESGITGAKARTAGELLPDQAVVVAL